MLNTWKMTVLIGSAVLFAAAAAQATQVPVGTLGISDYHFKPTVDNVNGAVVMGGSFSYDNGTDFFLNTEDPPLGVVASSTLDFSVTPNGTVLYDGLAGDQATITNFLTFYDSQDGAVADAAETYVFSLDQSITTISDGTTGQGTTISLYLLGDLTATGSEGTYTSPTPTAVTLTLDKTGASNWTYAATLSNPPPGLAVPEPASIVMLGGGLVALTVARRRKIR